ncbi:hypothetical protein BASA81_002623 [Batrachochytrium salamandrivorans]|nr:hypothetical protein BASA81_002623 [Batrachochytrium salamandrivorans]
MATQITYMEDALLDKTEVDKTVLALGWELEFPALQSLYTAHANKLKSFEFSNLLLLPEQTKKQHKRDPNPTPVLQSCFGHSKPQEVLTILGPEIKTQHELLRVLAGKRHAVNRLRSGEFLANNLEDLFPMVRSALVVSSPQHLKTSTVEEEFHFASALRTPGLVGVEERTELVQELLRALDLSQKAQTQIKLLAPHELRRVALGVELASLPNLLLVDQPFTGHRMADWEMARILRALAGLNLFQVVVAAHAPRPEVYQQLSSHVLLLSARGETLSIGTGAEAVKYLAGKGRHNTENLGEGDFLLLCAQYAKETWPAMGKGTTIKAMAVVPAPPQRPLRNAWVQFSWLFTRELKYLWRMASWLLFRFVTVAFILAFVAVLFMHGADQDYRSYTFTIQFASFVFPVLTLAFASAMPTGFMLFSFKQVVVREQNGETYSIATAMLVKNLTSLVINFALACESVLVLHYAIGWGANIMLIIAAFYVMMESCNSYAYFFAFSCKMFGKMFIMIIITLGLQLMFLGAAMRFSLMPTWIYWIHYVCNLAWAFKLLVGLEFNAALCQTPTTCAQWAAIKTQNLMSSNDTWQYFLILLAFLIFYRAWAFRKLYELVSKDK